MSSLVGSNDGNQVQWNFGRAPAFKDHICVWFEQKSASITSEKGAWDETIRIGEGVMRVEFLTEITFTPRTSESPVESIELLCGRCKDVLMAVNCSKDISRIHFLKAHKTKVRKLKK